MFLKFTITLLACSWGFAHAQDVSAPAGDPDAPAPEEAPGKSRCRTARRYPNSNPWTSTASR
ncbi:hypothetical protein ABFY27_14685 [Akkermansia massiliensis]